MTYTDVQIGSNVIYSTIDGFCFDNNEISHTMYCVQNDTHDCIGSWKSVRNTYGKSCDGIKWLLRSAVTE